MKGRLSARAKRGGLFFVIAILISTGIPIQQVVAAEPSAAPVAPERIEREYRYQSGQTLPEIEETIVDEQGNTYRLISSDGPITDSSYTPPSRYYTWQVANEIPLDGIDRLSAYFPPTVYVEDESFVGTIGLVANPYSITNIYESFSRQVDRYHTIENLPDNDASKLPLQMEFQVSSDVSYGATQTATLNLLSVEFEITGTSFLGLPNNYTAYLTYRGQESWLELHHYSVVASYAGSLTSTIEQYVIISRYELVVEPAITLVTPTISAPPLSMEAESEQLIDLSLAYAAAGIIVVLALAWLLLWGLFLRKNAKLVRSTEDKQEVLVRKHVSITAGEVVFKVPDEVDLYDHAQYVVELKPRLANQQGELLVSWRDLIVARGELKTSTPIDMDSIVIDGVISVMSEAMPPLAEQTTQA